MLKTGNWKLKTERNGKRLGSPNKTPAFFYFAAGIVIFVALIASPFSVPVSSTWWPAWAAMVFESG